MARAKRGIRARRGRRVPWVSMGRVVGVVMMGGEILCSERVVRVHVL